MRRFFFCLAMAVMCAGYPAVVRASEPFTVRAATFRGPSAFGMIHLLAAPPDLGENTACDVRVLPTPQEMAVRVASGQLDIAVFPANMAAKLYTAGPGCKFAAVVGLGVLFVVSGDASLRGWDDLRGRTVRSVGKGAGPDFLFRYLLSKNSLDPERDLTIDFSIKTAPQLARFVIAGKAEAAILPEPFVAMVGIKTKGKVRPALDFQAAWRRVQGTADAYPLTVMVVAPSLVRDRPDAARRFFDAYRRSIERVNDHPAEAARLIGKFEILPAALAEPAIPNCNLRYISADKARPMMEAYLKALLDFDPASIGGALPDDGFYLKP